jgi:hypothetical protein
VIFGLVVPLPFVFERKNLISDGSMVITSQVLDLILVLHFNHSVVIYLSIILALLPLSICGRYYYFLVMVLPGHRRDSQSDANAKDMTLYWSLRK